MLTWQSALPEIRTATAVSAGKINLTAAASDNSGCCVRAVFAKLYSIIAIRGSFYPVELFRGSMYIWIPICPTDFSKIFGHQAISLRRSHFSNVAVCNFRKIFGA